MPESFNCPHCQRTVIAPDHLLGGHISCPYCHGVFLAAIPLPEGPGDTPVQTSADPFAFTEPADGGDLAEPRHYGRQQPKMNFGAGVVLAVVVAVVMGVGLLAKDSGSRRRGDGFDFAQVVRAGVIGGVVAGGVALMRMLMAPKDGGRRDRRR